MKKMDNNQKSILILDDDPQVCLLLESILQGEGYRVTVTQTMQDAYHVLSEKTFNMLVTDMNLGDDYGLDLILEVKKLYPDMGVVVVTIIDDPMEAKKILAAGIFGYIVKPFSKSTVIITIENAFRRQQLERANQTSKRQVESQLAILMNNLHFGLVLIDANKTIIQVNDQMSFWFPVSIPGAPLELLKESFILQEDEYFDCAEIIRQTMDKSRSYIVEKQMRTVVGDRHMQPLFLPVESGDSKLKRGAIVMIEDMTQQLVEKKERDKSQKLEAIGQLAAGIAHEINSPVQFIGDNINFVSDGLETLFESFSQIEKMILEVEDKAVRTALQEQLKSLFENNDIEYFKEELPEAMLQSSDGVNRIAKIVKAMRQLSHPGSEDKVLTDINSGLESTITVSRNEWKYDSDLVTDFDSNLPAISCYPDDLNQVFLNIIVNAAHAISERVEQKELSRGTIYIKTEEQDDSVIITIKDNGGGIPDELREKVFEPFFTTKEIGKGTGQGLGIAKRIVQEKHCGSIDFVSQQDKGTTFTIRLPRSGCSISRNTAL